MVANAAVGDVVSVNDPAHADPATAATTNPGYALATEASNDGNLATASYVKGAYNAAIKAINKVAATAGSAVQSVTEGSTNGTVSVDGTDVAVHGLGSAAYTASTDYATAAQGTKADNAETAIGTMANLTGSATTLVGAIEEVRTAAGNAVQSVTEGSTNGTVSVDGTDVAVHGLGSAAYTASTDYATAAQGTKADNAATAIGTMANLNTTATDLVEAINEVKTTADSALTTSALTDYAKKTGVTQTITNSTISGTVPVVATWGSDTAGTVAITANITGATYAEPAQGGGN